MKGSMNSPELKEITVDHVMKLGKEWMDFILNATPVEVLLSTPQLEHCLDQEHRNGHRDGEARMLMRQLQRRFGSVPDWVNEKIAKADLASLEAWGLRFVDAQFLDEVFADKV
ncbi:MAG: DUF4351 domain-containing protein [Magnetococcus sp. DMHC-1]|nr:DUF4351 domain-containing protein [Magnetococcales bacterium]